MLFTKIFKFSIKYVVSSKLDHKLFKKIRSHSDNMNMRIFYAHYSLNLEICNNSKNTKSSSVISARCNCLKASRHEKRR